MILQIEWRDIVDPRAGILRDLQVTSPYELHNRGLRRTKAGSRLLAAHRHIIDHAVAVRRAGGQVPALATALSGALEHWDEGCHASALVSQSQSRTQAFKVFRDGKRRW